MVIESFNSSVPIMVDEHERQDYFVMPHGRSTKEMISVICGPSEIDEPSLVTDGTQKVNDGTQYSNKLVNSFT